jgi:hypothetical protein
VAPAAVDGGLLPRRRQVAQRLDEAGPMITERNRLPFVGASPAAWASRWQ